MRVRWAWLSIGLLATAPSARADVAATCVTESERGQLLRDDGKFLEARKLLLACAREECPRVVRRDCAEFSADLEHRIPSVMLIARDEAGKDLTNVRVTMDGEPFAQTLGVTGLAVDPGSHLFRFEWSEGPPVEARVLMREGEKTRNVAVVLTRRNAALTTEPPSPASATEPARAPTRREVPLMTWVLGGVALAGGVAFGALSLAAVDEAKRLERSCAPRCSDDQISPVETKFLVGRVAAGVGLAAAVGAILFFVLQRPTASTQIAF